MAADPRLSIASANAACNAVVDSIDAGGAGTIEIRSGTIPTNADTAIGAQVLLATLTFSATAFGAASNGVATAAAITSDSGADATGTASWARIKSGGGATVMDVTVGTSGDDVNFNTVSFVTGAVIAISALTYEQPRT